MTNKMEIPTYVQEMIAATNGRHYQGLIGRLKTLPIPDLPEKVRKEAQSRERKKWMLDIGSGWGRWLLAGANAGFMPVGLELKLEAARVARDLLKREGKRGFVVVADAGKPPFATESFDVIWSFSVLQHLHRKRAKACLERCAGLLKRGGLLAIELPTKFGIRNRFIRHSQEKEDDDWDSWVVRYYTRSEVDEVVGAKFQETEIKAHAFGGIGYLPVDLNYVPWRFRPLVLISEIFRMISAVFPILSKWADSWYVYARKA
jgi:SAM-dependent methyltransferase